MKRFLIAMTSWFMATAAAAQSYTYKIVPHADIDQHLVIASDATGTPKPLQGLFWLDFDALGDKVVSFASAKFEPIINAEDAITGFQAWIPVFDEGIWSWDDSKKGHDAYDGVAVSRLVYHVVFNPDFSSGTAQLIFRLAPGLPRVEIPNSCFLTFALNQVDADEYSRDSILLGHKFKYRFRRIVDGEGNRLPAYDDYLESLERLGLVNARLPVCEGNKNEGLPTSCAGQVH